MRHFRLVPLLLGLGLVACAGNPERPAESSLSCMQSVRDALPGGIPEAQAHCLAAGTIALQCSVIEARLAGAGKEIKDVFTGGDPSWTDWKADLAGIRCADNSTDPAELAQCCKVAGY